MTREDYWYLPPDPPDEERKCVYETADDNCGAPTEGLLCERHENAATAAEYAAYTRHYQVA